MRIFALILQKELTITLPYAAICVIGKSVNDLTGWMDTDKHLLKEIENSKITGENK